MQVSWEKLKDASEQRADKLDQALQSQRYYVDAADAETWVELKRVFVAGGGLGKDEDATEQLLKSTASTESDLEVFRQDTLTQLLAQVKLTPKRTRFASMFSLCVSLIKAGATRLYSSVLNGIHGRSTCKKDNGVSGCYGNVIQN